MASPSGCSDTMADAAVLAAVCVDLAAEHEALDQIVAGLADADWDTPTPAEGWTVRDQISHLAWVDDRAVEAVAAPDVFAAGVEELLAAAPDDPMMIGVQQGRAMKPGDVLAWWRASRRCFLEAMADVDPGARIPWYGPAMGAVSFVTARLMETWAHGQDVVDALGAARPATPRLHHVAHIGWRAMGFSFQARGLETPAVPMRVELLGPDGATWAWGSEGAEDIVRGVALDFCLVVTQRRHVNDTNLEIAGPVAHQWMTVAQAFAGPPGPGRRPGQFGAP
jgi:uncharacterized protein (TIGR03084 family)